ncbi:NapC/NirT family cytochrome c [uncultured Rhodospira sp.]|uniref:NapC/NirT family cytochrome c n=1 Tax=uncultured Rhodospira sp. TaxID=1936189 RepID=UPI00263A03BF|nr:NapC/NirT family cytochrome c [uncultured Rhodospira sp.]
MSASDPSDKPRRRGLFRWLWRNPFATTTSTTIFVLGLLVLIGGGYGGFTVFAKVTNSNEFCISCHEMEVGPYAEYKTSIHYANRTGMRVTCADCHVPRDFFPKLWAKIVASKDVYHHLLGTIDTPEKFEAHRLEMAERVWAKLEATQSRECRECHDFAAMDLFEQGRRAELKHPDAMMEGRHCIECHKGVVHELPEGYEG